MTVSEAIERFIPTQAPWGLYYERTSSKANRVYVDLDGKAALDMSQQEYHDLTIAITNALIALPTEHRFCVMQSNAYSVVVKGKEERKLSYRLNFVAIHGTKT